MKKLVGAITAILLAIAAFSISGAAELAGNGTDFG